MVIGLNSQGGAGGGANVGFHSGIETPTIVEILSFGAVGCSKT